MTLIEAQAEIERLRADKDVIRSQERNAAYELDIAALEAEIERLRAALKEIQDNGYRAALCHAVAKTALEQIPMTLRELTQKEAAAEIDEVEKNAEIERLRAVLKDGWSTLALFNVKNYHPTLVTLQAQLLAGLEQKFP